MPTPPNNKRKSKRDPWILGACPPNWLLNFSKISSETWKHQSKQKTVPPTHHDRHLPEDEEWDNVVQELLETWRNIIPRVHQSTSAAPEIDHVLEETQNSPFTARISNNPIWHTGKTKFPRTMATRASSITWLRSALLCD